MKTFDTNITGSTYNDDENDNDTTNCTTTIATARATATATVSDDDTVVPVVVDSCHTVQVNVNVNRNNETIDDPKEKQPADDQQEQQQEQQHELDNNEHEPIVISDTNLLLQYGIVSNISILSNQLTKQFWDTIAQTYIQITPELIFNEGGDNTYPFYRNIRTCTEVEQDEDADDEHEDDTTYINFPFEHILEQEYEIIQYEHLEQDQDNTSSSLTDTETTPETKTTTRKVPTAIGQALLDYFPVQSLLLLSNDNDNTGTPNNTSTIDQNTNQKEQKLPEIQLDDAFCIHYNDTQLITIGSKHMDPSDITINICIYKSNDCIGSHVQFYGTKQLQNVTSTENEQEQQTDNTNFTFLVKQQPYTATIHYGNHLHSTTKLVSGSRTNIILTYCYTDTTRSDVAIRSCYATTTTTSTSTTSTGSNTTASDTK